MVIFISIAYLAVLDPEFFSRLNGLFSLLNIRTPQKFKAGWPARPSKIFGRMRRKNIHT